MNEDSAKLLVYPHVEELQHIYKSYTIYKKFKSVMPIFNSEFVDPNNDCIGYYVNDKLVGFSLLRKFDSENVEAIQFAWTYEHNKLRLGIESLKHECAYYKSKGYKYLYLGNFDDYKKEIEGFEILGVL